MTAGFDVGAERPARPTIAQLREVTQPPSVRSRAAAEGRRGVKVRARRYTGELATPIDVRSPSPWSRMLGDERKFGEIVSRDA